MVSVMDDYGASTRGRVFGDASAALGILNRRGLGRTRHIDTGLLRIQEAAAAKRLEFNKVLGTMNPADLSTQYLTKEIWWAHCRRFCLRFRTGRAESAPKLNVITKAGSQRRHLIMMLRKATNATTTTYKHHNWNKRCNIYGFTNGNNYANTT